MILKLLLICIPLAATQVPVYLRTPALPASIYGAAPVAQIQCSQQCMPTCLPSCLVAQYPSSIYQPYPSVVAATPYQIVPSIASAPQPVAVPRPIVAQAPAVSSGYQPYGASIAYIPVVPSCLSQCMPTCAPACLESNVPTTNPQRDDLPTPPPETVPTPAPEVSTTPVPTDVVPCKCLVKITITQGNKTVAKCGPNACSCPQGYNQCGSNCCKA
uniref:CC domain-containing protein n=1 Tax=Caenorhabditis tropicalis TaxID=1561998 RepID=A0A1I7UQ71_9PELO